MECVRIIQAARQGVRDCVAGNSKDRSKFPGKCPDWLLTKTWNGLKVCFWLLLSYTGSIVTSERVHMSIGGHEFFSFAKNMFVTTIFFVTSGVMVQKSPESRGMFGMDVWKEGTLKKKERQTILYILASCKLNPNSGNLKYVLFKNFPSTKYTFSYFGKLTAKF